MNEIDQIVAIFHQFTGRYQVAEVLSFESNETGFFAKTKIILMFLFVTAIVSQLLFIVLRVGN